MGTQSSKTNKRSIVAALKKLGFNKKLGLMAFVAIFGVVAASIIISSQAATRPHKPGGNVYGASVYLTPSAQKVSANTNFSFQIWEDSLTQPVNAVQTNLTYDSRYFDFVDIDSSGSAFEIQALSAGSNGTIAVARGHVGELKGKQLVATITLKAKSSSGKTNITFAPGTMLSSKDTNQDILQSKIGGTYSFSR